MLCYCVAGSIGHTSHQLDHGVCGPVQRLPCSSRGRLSDMCWERYLWDIYHHWTISMEYLITVVLNLDIGTFFIARKVCLLPPQPPPLHTSLQCCSPPRCPARRWAMLATPSSHPSNVIKYIDFKLKKCDIVVFLVVCILGATATVSFLEIIFVQQVLLW